MPIGKTNFAWLSVADAIHFVFHSYHLPEGVEDIRIEGDSRGLSLYVNGKLQERLEGRTKKDLVNSITYGVYGHQETLIFPLQQIGMAWTVLKED